MMLNLVPQTMVDDHQVLVGRVKEKHRSKAGWFPGRLDATSLSLLETGDSRFLHHACDGRSTDFLSDLKTNLGA